MEHILVFCSKDSVSGNLILNFIFKSPLHCSFLLNIPSPGITFTVSGVTYGTCIGIIRLSSVVIVLDMPPIDSARVTSHYKYVYIYKLESQ